MMNVAQANHYELFFSGFPVGLRTQIASNGADYYFLSRAAGLLCYDANLPGSSLATFNIEGNFTGVQQQYAHTRQFGNISLGFYCDSEYKMLKFFESWIDYVAGGGSQDKRNRGYFYRMRYPDAYKCEGLKIAKFERDYNRGIQYNFVSAFPVNVNSVPVSYEAQNTILRIQVEFNYDRYIMGQIGENITLASQTQGSGSVLNSTDISNTANNTNSSRPTGQSTSGADLSSYFTDNQNNTNTFEQNLFNQQSVDNFLANAHNNWNPTIPSRGSDAINFVADA